MTQLNDAIQAVVGDQINDGLLAHYQLNGATSNQINDAEREFLVAAGATPGHLNDMWREALVSIGITAGQLNDMKLVFWRDLGGVFGDLVEYFIKDTGDGSEDNILLETGDNLLLE